MGWEISDIYFSIQGEGFHTGKPLVFIRFKGCNLDCPFCDEKAKTGTFLTWQNIINKIQTYNCRNILLTGGEPLLQKNISHFIKELKERAYTIHIETNGTIPLNISPSLRKKLWITVSPKRTSFNIFADEYKFLYDEFSPDLCRLWSEISAHLAEWHASCPHLFLQPVFYDDAPARTKENLKQTINIVKKYPQFLRLSVQTHKYLGIK